MPVDHPRTLPIAVEDIAHESANGISMMLSDEQLELRALARRFALERLRPAAAILERDWRLPVELLADAAELGLTSYGIPEQYGGGGFDPVTQAVIMEELNYGDAGLAALLTAGQLFAGGLVAADGDADQRAAWLRRFTGPSGAWGGIAFSEPHAGSDLANIRATAMRDGDEWVLNGEKTWITAGGEFADGILVFARTGEPGSGAAGISTFLVEGSAGGLSSTKLDLLGFKTSYTGSIHLDDVRLSADRLVGTEGAGFRTAMRFFAKSRPQVAAAALGIARAAFEHAAAYANEREAFGSPIADMQGVSFLLADMGMRVEAARALVWQACDVASRGADVGLVGSYAKAFASDVAMSVTTDAVQVLGGAGLDADHPTGRWMRDAKVMQIVEGTNQVQREIASRYYRRGAWATQ